MLTSFVAYLVSAFILFAIALSLVLGLVLVYRAKAESKEDAALPERDNQHFEGPRLAIARKPE